MRCDDAAARAFAEMRAILGGERDSFCPVWDAKASERDRRLLLAMAGCQSGTEQFSLAQRSWRELSPEIRSRVKYGLAKFQLWAAALCAGEGTP
jgi:hypothetical protein